MAAEPANLLPLFGRDKTLRILIIDYSGHPFQVQLARALAGRRHDVRHVHSASFQTPKGELQKRADDPPGLAIVGVSTAEPFAKHSFVKRRRQEIEIGRRIAEQITEFRPAIVLSSNAPLDTQKVIEKACRRSGARFVFWVQDLYGEAILRILGAKLGPVGRAIGRFYRGRERRMLREADHVVAIAEDFRPALHVAGVPDGRITVIENWAPLASIPRLPRDNDWAERRLSPAPFRAVYSGTLGFKHDPALLLTLARARLGDVLVFSEGPAADALKADAEAEGLDNLKVEGWLPFADLPKALAAADMLVVLLEPDAGLFSVPSKVLTYLCVGRPILGSMPPANLAARTIANVGAGIVAVPGDRDAFVGGAHSLAADADRRAHMGDAARGYAERTFGIDRITDRFERIFDALNS